MSSRDGCYLLTANISLSLDRPWCGDKINPAGSDATEPSCTTEVCCSDSMRATVFDDMIMLTDLLSRQPCMSRPLTLVAPSSQRL